MNHVTDVLEAACVPAVAPASPAFFGTADFATMTSHPGDLKELFTDTRYAAFRTYRATSKSRFLGLTVPYYLARLPYGKDTDRAPGVDYFEERADGDDVSRFVWGSLAFVYAELVGTALAETGWPSRCTGWLGGGRRDDMPFYTYTSAGKNVCRPSTQKVIDEELEPALASLGFISAQWNDGTPSIVFDAAVSSHQPAQTIDATANAADQILSRLPLMAATCRVGAHLRVMAKQLVGANWDTGDIKAFLTSWVSRIVVANDASPEIKARFPLKSAVVDVMPTAVPGGYVVDAELEHWVPVDNISIKISVAPPAAKPAGK
jgi:type VI secretion system protein ImpC